MGGLLRPPDTLARLAGDEYVAVCEDLDSTDHAAAIGERMTAALHRPFTLSTCEVTVSASIGIAYSHTGEHDAEQLLHEADMAMYQAKHKGGARQQLFDPLEQHVADRAAGLSRDLHQAAQQHQLHLEYQPIVDTHAGTITGFEALLRWRHPHRGLIPPTTLIPLAEQSDLINAIGRWVLEQACTDQNSWVRHGDGDHLTMAVNVSAHQLMAPDFVAGIAAVLQAADTAPNLLTLEITETAFIQDSDRALLILRDLKGLGVTLALDDFGTGFSSLTYLQRFTIDIIKIDRSLTAEIARNTTTRIIVDSIVDLAHKLSMTVVAEGVETAEQHQQVSDLGCDFSQGYYFAKPMRSDDARQLLQRRHSLPSRPPEIHHAARQ